MAGSNGVHLQAAADPRAGRAVVVAAIDNLGKGAAGQAVQNANLMLGLPETAGLTVSGVARERVGGQRVAWTEERDEGASDEGRQRIQRPAGE